MTTEAYTQRFDEALGWAHELHRDQTRKGKDVPYINHLMAVASLVGTNGGDEDQVIAALLHDAIEDCVDDVPEVADEIRDRFGDRVYRIVDGCTDAYEQPKPPWGERKRQYIDHLAGLPDDSPVLLVSLADKLHNARSIWRDYQSVGDYLWDRFTGGHGGTLWYYSSLAEIFLEKRPGPLAAELAGLVGSIREESGPPELAKEAPTDNGLLVRRLRERLDEMNLYDALDFVIVEAPDHVDFLAEIDPTDLTVRARVGVVPDEPLTDEVFGTDRGADFRRRAERRLRALRDRWASRGFEAGDEAELRAATRGLRGAEGLSMVQRLERPCESVDEVVDTVQWLDEEGLVFEIE